jgi:CMP-N,N'-diacetyllegionaminic acid synthase
MGEDGLFCLCVVPARGGSKGLPGKNLMEVGGKSLVRLAVEAALDSGRCDRLLCSTDSDAIAAEAVLAGAEAPFRRPDELAGDATPSLDVVLHALQFVEAQGPRRVDLVCLVEPTTPLRVGQDIRCAVDLLASSRPPADSAVSVCEVTDAHPAWLRKIQDGLMSPYFTDLPEPTRRQDLARLPTPYRRNGAVYVTRRDVLVERRSLYGERCLAYVMPPERSVNIDSELDLLCARAILQKRFTIDN